MIYAENLDGEIYSENHYTERLSWFYLHGKLEDLNGYDICCGDIEEFQKSMSIGLHLSTVTMVDGSKHDVLVCKKMNNGSVYGLIVALDDTTENLMYCINNVSYFKIYEHEKERLKLKYPNVWLLIENYF